MHHIGLLHNSLKMNTHYVNKHNQTILTNTVSILSGQTVPVEVVSNSLHMHIITNKHNQIIYQHRVWSTVNTIGCPEQ